MPTFTFDGEFLGVSTYQTKSLELNQGNIKKALLSVPSRAMSDPAQFVFGLSNDGGVTFWNVTNNVLFVFPTTGQDLRLRVVATSGATLTIRQSDGTDTTWSIQTTH